MRAPIAMMILLGASLLSGCTAPDAGDCSLGDVEPDSSGLFALMATTHGCLVIELYPDDAPTTVDNFVQYAEDGFYEGTIFHRIIPGFVIQGGGFTESGTRKETRAPIPLEANLPNLQWTLSMARTNDPNSGTSQFFVNLVDNRASLDPGPSGPGYAVFGKVVDGTSYVEDIAAEPIGDGPQPGMADWPADPPRILGVTIDDSAYEAPLLEEARWGLEAGLIPDTQDDDGAWVTTISSTDEVIPFWVRNTGNQEDALAVSITAPSRWDITMQPADIVLQPQGERSFEGGRPSYAYATPGLLLVRYDAEAAANESGDIDDNVTIRFQSEDAHTTVTLEIVLDVDDPLDGVVSKAGSQVELDYRGTFDDGEEFDAGTFPTTLGSGQTVAGFDFGLMGLSVGETVTIRFPPELGYGHDNPDGSRLAKFNGEWLNFEVTLTSIE